MFLPNNYTIPENRGYLKFKDGENNFRVLSSAIVGWEYWNKDNKPIRSQEIFKKLPDDIRLEADGTPSKIKHFWAFVVWNYEAKAVQILEITQATIQKQLKALVDNKKWGDPKGYDITITRTGEGFDTAYIVMPNPYSELATEIVEAYKDKKITLNALYSGGNPFETTNDEGRDDEGYEANLGE